MFFFFVEQSLLTNLGRPRDGAPVQALPTLSLYKLVLTLRAYDKTASHVGRDTKSVTNVVLGAARAPSPVEDVSMPMPKQATKQHQQSSDPRGLLSHLRKRNRETRVRPHHHRS